MLSTARFVSRRVVTANIAPRAAAAVGSTRCMSIADQLGRKVSNVHRDISDLFVPIDYHTNRKVILVYFEQIKINYNVIGKS